MMKKKMSKRSRKTQKIRSTEPSEYASSDPAASTSNSGFDSFGLEELQQKILNLELNTSITKEVAKESVNATIARFSGSGPIFEISATSSTEITEEPPFSATGMLPKTSTTKECINGAIAEFSSSGPIFEVSATSSIPRSLESTENSTLSATGPIAKFSATWVLPTYSATGTRPKNRASKKVRSFVADETIPSETRNAHPATTKSTPISEFSTNEEFYASENEVLSSDFRKVMSNCSKAPTVTKSVTKNSDGKPPNTINAKTNTEPSFQFKVKTCKLDDHFTPKQVVPGETKHEGSSSKTSQPSEDSETVESVCMDFLSFKQNATERIEYLEWDLQKTINVIKGTMANSSDISERMDDMSTSMPDDEKGINTEIAKLKCLIRTSQTNLNTIDCILSKFQEGFKNYVEITDNANSGMDEKLAKVMKAILPRNKD